GQPVLAHVADGPRLQRRGHALDRIRHRHLLPHATVVDRATTARRGLAGAPESAATPNTTTVTAADRPSGETTVATGASTTTATRPTSRERGTPRIRAVLNSALPVR